MVEEEEKDLSTRFLQMQENQLIDLQEHFESYCNVLPVFGFNSAKYDINWFDCPEKMNDTKLPPYNYFFSILRNSNPLEKDYNDFQYLVNSGLTTEQPASKLRTDRIPLIGAEKYSYLQSVCKNTNMHCFLDFLKWYKNKDVVPTLEAMQKMIEFYHNKGIDMLKLGYAKRFTGLFNKLTENVLTISYSLPWMHDDKEMKIQIPVLLPRL